MLKSARRTHVCGELREAHIGQKVLLQGWASACRDKGGVVFLNLRDRHGVVQVVADERVPESVKDDAAKVRLEYVVEVEGEVVARQAANPKLPTGAVEVLASAVRILTRTEPLPFPIEGGDAHEETRLKYRFLDLRRSDLQRNLVVRHRMAQAVRRYLDSEGFLEIETPVLTRSTPEGARDYLVPSRVHPGQWFALPQSPQIFKQILMVGGLDRYFQIVKCFRDEDLRADRQPEFTQIDIEMSFPTHDTVIEMAEGVLRSMFHEVLGMQVGEIPRIAYRDAIARFGVDNPDVRFGLEHVDLTTTLKDSATDFIRAAIAEGGIAKAMVLPGAAEKASRKVIDGWTDFVKRYGMTGLMWAKVEAGGWSGPAAKLLSDAEKAAVGATSPGDVVLIGVGAPGKVNPGLGRLRGALGKELGYVQPGSFGFCWVVEFPAFEWDADEGRWGATHHPFTAPLAEHVPYFGTGREGEIYSDAYDLVCNGYEIAGGSIRIHDPEVQSKVFTALGISKDEAERRFGFLLGALRHGAPPHGGIAFGFDRCAMLLAGTENIRDVIAFPKTAKAQDLMAEAPNTVDEKQLRELYVRNVEK